MTVKADSDSDVGAREVALRTDSGDLTGQLIVSRLGHYEWALMLTADGREWHGSGSNLFDALRELRRFLDEDGLVIGLNGARPECALSGMLADMGEGRQAYVLTIPQTDNRPKLLGTLAPAPLSEVSDIADQDAYKRNSASLRSPSPVQCELLPPGDRIGAETPGRERPDRTGPDGTV